LPQSPHKFPRTPTRNTGVRANNNAARAVAASPHAPRTQRKSKARSQGQSVAKRSANRQGEGIHAQGRGVDFVAGTRAMIRYVDAPRELSTGRWMRLRIPACIVYSAITLSRSAA